MNDQAAQAEVIAFLADPLSYDGDIKTIERHETHGAIVFLAGERAYKLKRAVKFPYMDYSTVERRREMCMREFAINRAPALYLDVFPIVRMGAALGFGRREGKKATDWVVVMRRFDQSALLENMLDSDGFPGMMRRVAEELVHVHTNAEIVHDFGGETAMRDVVSNNVMLLKSRTNRPFHGDRVASYEGVVLRTLTRVSPLLEERRKRDRVRRCHGDLHVRGAALQP